MNVQVMINLNSTDLARSEKLFHAFNLVGGRDAFSEYAQKAWGRIKSNQFSWQDVRVFERAMRARITQLRESADKDVVFLDPQVNKVWADGVKSSADLAERNLNEFIEDLKDDWQNASR